MTKNKILIFSATYNEAENIENFLNLIDELNLALDILLIDDNSPDNTWKKIQEYSKNKENAVKLLEFLTTDFAQKHIVNNTYEYSILENVEPNPIVKKMTGNIVEDVTTDISSFGKFQSKALEIMLKNGWK